MLDTYKTKTQDSEQHGETNDCSVIALSIVAECSYAKALKAMTDAGRKPRKGATLDQMLTAAASLGIDLECVYASNVEWVRQVYGKPTMRTVARRFNTPNKHFLAFVRGHVAAFRDGEVADWTNGRRHQVQAVFEVGRA